LIRQYFSDLFIAIRDTTRAVVLFNEPRLPSFAALNAQGMAFFSTSAEDDEVFFVEDIPHQCGHVLFNVLTLDPSRVMGVSRETKLRQFTGRDDETRTVYEAFHGAFTEALMCHCFDRVIEAPGFTDRQRHELLGRFAFIMNRSVVDLRALDRRELFTDAGWTYMAAFKQQFEEIRRRRRGELAQFDVSRQPYVFSYGTFLTDNPVDRGIPVSPGS
jgi:hypothetical protein